MMPKVKKTDIAIIALCAILVIILGACSPQGVPAGDFCDVFDAPVIFVSGEGVSAAIDGESDLLDRTGVTQILTLNEYQADNCS